MQGIILIISLLVSALYGLDFTVHTVRVWLRGGRPGGQKAPIIEAILFLSHIFSAFEHIPFWWDG